MQILTADQIYQADKATIESGISGETLMENAGAAATDEIIKRYKKCPVVVLCGPGNNGGDGFVVARLLKKTGWDVRVAILGDIANLQGDAALEADRFSGEIEKLNEDSSEGAALIVDALFGVGLKRPLEGDVLTLIKRIKKYRIPVVAIDVPSGVASDSSTVLGEAFEAETTVTFTRKKICHMLYPAKRFCGDVVVADIGIKGEIIESTSPYIFENRPDLWLDEFPFPKEEQNKYDRGHAVINGGGIKCTGAATLASVACLKTGAGLATVACPKSALMLYATKLTSVMTKAITTTDDFKEFLEDKRKNAVCLGPGNGVDEFTRQLVLVALSLRKSCVIDADAISVFEDNPQELFDAIKSPVIITPHEGEFKRLFSYEGEKIEKAIQAAKQSGAVIILKGADSIIASPDGRVVINDNAPPWLATAGSGDVLAGMATALLANNMDAFDAACAAVWMHGRAAQIAGMGMISESLLTFIPNVLQEMANSVSS